MEMASGCPRQAITQEDSTPHKPVRGPHGGWQKREIDALRERIEQAEKSGESLRSVFDDMGRCLGRKPNSIRNFYYAQMRDGQDEQRTLPFETFTQEEIEQLVTSVLTARAQGMSVRACVRELSGGDHSRMLRYQNKYRSVVRTRPELVHRIMEKLSQDGVAYVSPYPGESVQNAPARIDQLKTRATRAGDEQVAQLFDALAHLLALAFDKPEAADEAPLPGGQDAALLRRADRLKAQCDVLRIELDDERTRRTQLRREAEGMVTVIKEYIALPDADRASHCGAFCQQAAARLSAMECALMEE